MVVLGFLRWVMVATVVLVCGFLVVRFGFDGFCLLWLLWVLGLWVLFTDLSSASLLPLTVRLLFLKFSLVSVVVFVFFFFFFFFFFVAMGLIFGWMLIVVAVGWPWVWVCC